MPWFDVETSERVRGIYPVEANDADEAERKFVNGDVTKPTVFESVDVDVVSVKERDSETNPSHVHWIVTYADRSRGDNGRYVVVEGRVRPRLGTMEKPGGKRIPFQYKPEAIVEAQRRNGYEPVDGSEQTYARQLSERGLR